MKTDKLAKLGACADAITWAAHQGSRQQAWDACQRGDWMLWLIGKLAKTPGSDARRKLVMCSCEITRTALPHVPDGEDRPRLAIETAESWARREGATLDDVRTAANAAYDAYAAYAYATANAADAAYATASAAYADAAYATASAAYATATANATATAAYAAARAARAQSLSRFADIVRRYYPRAPRL
jgi:hypothetical protein